MWPSRLVVHPKSRLESHAEGLYFAAKAADQPKPRNSEVSVKEMLGRSPDRADAVVLAK
jgi:hypothetical protein